MEILCVQKLFRISYLFCALLLNSVQMKLIGMQAEINLFILIGKGLAESYVWEVFKILDHMQDMCQALWNFIGLLSVTRRAS